MTQLVLHTGTPTSGCSRVQAALLGWREPLADAGVALLPQNRAVAWDRAVQQLLSGAEAQPMRKLLRQSQRDGAQTVWLTSRTAYRLLRRGKHLQTLLGFCKEAGASATVVLVVREQLALLNELYVDQVTSMRTAGGFEPFVAKAVESGAYHYATAFRALLDSAEARLVAVPYSRLATGDPARVVLREAGVSGDVVDGLPAAEPAAGGAGLGVGPVLLTATRLLHKRLARMGIPQAQDDAALELASRQLREVAQNHGWDDDEFWGWSPELAKATAAEFRHPDAEFAAGAWASDWPDQSPQREQTSVDLASRSPDLVVDVMSTIQQCIEDLFAKPAKRTDQGQA